VVVAVAPAVSVVLLVALPADDDLAPEVERLGTGVGQVPPQL
jgi:hypothetical protein